jgi:outer membrane protein assembly factor BamB
MILLCCFGMLGVVSLAAQSKSPKARAGVQSSASKPSPDAPATGFPQLVLIEKKPKSPLTTAQMLGLSGENKPAGETYRYRRFVPKTLPPFVRPDLLDAPPKPDGDSLELTLELLDSTSKGWLALYATPIAGSISETQTYRAMLYAPDGALVWNIVLNKLFSRDDFIEIQDIRLDTASGLVYMNEACITYAKEAENKCSSLLCLDPVKETVLWRTPSLVSNNMFLLTDKLIICGYGFTAEKDYVFTLDKESGKILTKTQVESAPEYYEIKDNALYVLAYKQFYKFALPK